MLSYSSVNLDPSAGTEHGVLLLHAFPLSAEMWQAQLSMLERRRVAAVAPNIYGVEGSPEKKGWTFGDYAGELASLLSAVKMRKATVVGLSMGGYQAFELWRSHPETVASLVLCDTRAEQDNEEALANRRDFASAVRASGAEEAVTRMLPNVFARKAYTGGSALVDTFGAIVKKQSGDVIASAMEAIASRVDSVDTLPRISCPVTFIYGDEDKLTPKTLGESMQQRIPGSRLRIINGAGHLSNMERPDLFNDCLAGHLQEVIPGFGSDFQVSDDVEKVGE